MNFCLVADDGEARVVIAESDKLDAIQRSASYCALETWDIHSSCKFHVCRREPSANGTQRVVIETWEKGRKV